MRLPLPIRSYRDAPAYGARLVNMQAEQMPPDAKGPVTLMRTPGVASWVTAGNGPGRGLAIHQGRVYAVSGNAVYRCSPLGAVAIGTISGTERTYRASNGIELVVVTETGAGYSVTSSVSAISDPDFLARIAGPCGFVDQYIAFVERNSGRWFISDLATGAVYGPLDFATAEGSPDNLVSLIVDHRNVILLGKDSVEVWGNTGRSGFPFERVPGGFVELGALAPAGVVKADNSIFWLASDRTIRRLSGATPVRVSNHGVERALLEYDRVDDCEAITYTHGGHICGAFNFPDAGYTWVFDVTTGEWHERESYPSKCWDVCDAVTLDGATYVQHRTTGAVGILSAGTYQEWGNILRAEWAYGNVQEERKRIFHHEFRLNAQSGVGLITGQGSNPDVGLHWSDDGGETWVLGPSRTLGGIGARNTLTRWQALGASRDRVYRNVVSDPVPVRVFGAEIEATLGTT